MTGLEAASPPVNAGGAPAVSLGSSVAIAYENGTEVGADVAVDTRSSGTASPFAASASDELRQAPTIDLGRLDGRADVRRAGAGGGG